MSAPYILIILFVYVLTVSVYTGFLLGTSSMVIRIVAGGIMILGYILLERGPFRHSTLAFWVPTLLLAKILSGTVFFGGDFLIFTYYIGSALISLTYLRPKGLALYIAVVGAVLAVLLFVFNRNLLGASFTMVQNYLNFMTSIGLSTLIYVFGKSYSQTLSDMTKARSEANQAAITKSNFLANMSHEIRTPMNAITGMSELLLRGELSDESRGYAQDIKHAAGNLLSIINDLLDFSKIEAGKLEIIPVKYLLASLVNDAVTIVKMRLEDKPIRFYTNVDSNIPNALIGDEVRVRQILINLLTNAVKYTEKGNIGFSILQEKRSDDTIWLKMTVSDTGYGIKSEDTEKLFNDFVRLDTKKTRDLEGTGLGLSIVKRLCVAMGGDISVTSEYGTGSCFSVLIPQKIGSHEPFSAVNDPETKKVLVYERRDTYAKSVCWSLSNMNVPYFLANSDKSFVEALFGEQWYFVFSGYGLYGKINLIMNRPDRDFPGGKRPPIALMVEWGNEAYVPNVRVVSIPVQSLSIANVLNDKTDHRDYFEIPGTIHNVFPKSRVLVVDDIPTNLRVTQGLLAPYKIVVDICTSGSEAIGMVKQCDYDIIFMDHMMPEMDGIEATAIIRAWEKERNENGNIRDAIPIVALTANAVSGMRELFLGKGFDDFLAKPVDVSKLDEILERWIPRKKRERNKDVDSVITTKLAPNESLPVIPGINVAKTLTRLGVTLAGYLDLLITLCKDIEDRLPMLQTMPNQETLPVFINSAHALKGTCASLGAIEVSEKAARLEVAGKAKDLAFIEENQSYFVENLVELMENISATLDVRKGVSANENAGEEASQDISASTPLLCELAATLKSRNAFETDRILEELDGKPQNAKTKIILKKISDDVLMMEFDNALKTVEALLALNSHSGN
ncbi:MAG: ATP-binding protein [Treponema sp.]|nr:ATP-binding protein [Treponema sp.]